MKVKSICFFLLLTTGGHVIAQQDNVLTKNLTLQNNSSKWLLAASPNSTKMYIASINGSTVRQSEAVEFETNGRVKLNGNIAGMWIEAAVKIGLLGVTVLTVVPTFGSITAEAMC